MRKKREFIDGSFYHVTSRTNDKIRVFENNLGRKLMLITLQDAKDKFRFRLANFCVMPTHLHLLIEPGEGTCLSQIMFWIKLQTAKRWNRAHLSKDHLWGSRYFARRIKEPQEFYTVMEYIDQNPITAGLATAPDEWQASGAFCRARNISGLVDLYPQGQQPCVKSYYPIPPEVSRLLPPAQLAHTEKYIGAFSEAVERLYAAVKAMPNVDTAAAEKEPPVYLHYFTGTAEYLISGYDGNDTLYGKARFAAFPSEAAYQKFSLTSLKSNQFLELDFSFRA